MRGKNNARPEKRVTFFVKFDQGSTSYEKENLG